MNHLFESHGSIFSQFAPRNTPYNISDDRGIPASDRSPAHGRGHSKNRSMNSSAAALRLLAASCVVQLLAFSAPLASAALTGTTVGSNSQSPGFAVIPDQVLGDGPFTLGLAASSGLPVVLSVVSGPAVVSGYTVTVTGVGKVTLQAAQAGNGSFLPTVISQSFHVTAPSLPAITAAPRSQNVVAGQSITFTVGATGAPAPSYQWSFNGGVIVGATRSTLTLSNVQLTHAGAYSVAVTNLAGTITTTAANLTVTPAASRIVNFSARALSGPGSESLIMGFVVAGDGKMSSSAASVRRSPRSASPMRLRIRCSRCPATAALSRPTTTGSSERTATRSRRRPRGWGRFPSRIAARIPRCSRLSTTVSTR